MIKAFSYLEAVAELRRDTGFRAALAARMPRKVFVGRMPGAPGVRNFDRHAAFADFLKAQGKKEFTSDVVLDFFVARGWQAAAAKQNVTTYLAQQVAQKTIRVTGRNGQYKRYRKS